MISNSMFRCVGAITLLAALTACGASGQAALTQNSPGTSTPTGTNPATSSVQFTQANYAVTAGSRTGTLSVSRTVSTVGAASVSYSTADGTAVAGVDYTAASGTLSWAAGDGTNQTISIPIIANTASSGQKTLSIALTSPSGGAALGAPSSATVTVQGSAPPPPAGSLSLTAATYSVAQSAGTVAISVARTGGSSGAVTVAYASANGTATAGTDYTATNGTLSWAAADTAAKTFTVAISNTTPFSGSRTFTIALSGATGGAVLGTPASATTTINGTVSTGTCAKSSTSYTTTGAFDSFQYGNYFVNNNNWGGTPGQSFWSNSQDCWGVTTTSILDGGSIGSYPSVTRGWSQNATIMQQASTPGTNDWTTKSGMGIAVTQLTKSKIHWAFKAPTNLGVRWLGLQDIYFHKTANPAPTEFPPFVDVMIDQSIADQLVNGSTFYALVALQSHGTTITVGGNQYLIFIDEPGETGYHQSGGHNIHLFNLPTAFTSSAALAIWGRDDADNDLAAIVKFFMQANPVDDAGKPLQNSAGSVITSPLIASNLYLTAINSGWEIDTGTAFTNTAFCVAMQSEADCP
jgi:hypothetical protein